VLRLRFATGIDTIEIADRLEAAERERRAAEEIALVFQEVFEQQLGQLVTKEYLHAELDRLRAEFRAEIAQLRTEMAELRTELKGDIAQLRGELKLLLADMEKTELRITNAPTLLLGALVAGAVAVLGDLDIFFRLFVIPSSEPFGARAAGGDPAGPAGESGAPCDEGGRPQSRSARTAASAPGQVTCGLWLASSSRKVQPGSAPARRANGRKVSSGPTRPQNR
jgi:hypothetical protein